MKRTLILLTIIFLLSTAAVVMLFELTVAAAPSYSSFDRIFKPVITREAFVSDLKYNSWYIAGVTGRHIYLGNSTAPLLGIRASLNRNDTLHFRIAVAASYRLKLTVPQLRIDSPFFYLSDGQAPLLLNGSVDRWVAKKYMFDSAYFMKAAPVTPTTTVLLSTATQSRENILVKESTTLPHLAFAPALLEKQVDGVFCTDGMLHYAKRSNMLVYVYYYRNQFICTDTTLNLKYRGNTIDTISKAKISVKNVRAEHYTAMSAPALVTNKSSCVWDKYLFVESGIRAKNETKKEFDSRSVVDVYALDRGTYQGTFYIPLYKGIKASGFQPSRNKVTAIYENYLVVYEADFSFGRSNVLERASMD